MVFSRHAQLVTAALLSCCLLFPGTTTGFQNLFPQPSSLFGGGSSSNKSPSISSGAIQLENELIQAINELGEDNRLMNSKLIDDLVLKLETSKQGIPNPAIADEIYGRWKLIHTDNANTASPIQRKAVDTTSFPIYQDIIFNENNQLIVSQVVQFNKDSNSELRVDALASTSAYPLPELTERQGDGTFFGINILGVSKIGKDAEIDPNLGKDSRIDFVFDYGSFDLFDGKFKIPYPVPFRLPILRDAVKGWIDITYLSNRLRISRGNKGTTFILLKEKEEV